MHWNDWRIGALLWCSAVFLFTATGGFGWLVPEIGGLNRECCDFTLQRFFWLVLLLLALNFSLLAGARFTQVGAAHWIVCNAVFVLTIVFNLSRDHDPLFSKLNYEAALTDWSTVPTYCCIDPYIMIENHEWYACDLKTGRFYAGHGA